MSADILFTSRNAYERVATARTDGPVRCGNPLEKNGPQDGNGARHAVAKPRTLMPGHHVGWARVGPGTAIWPRYPPPYSILAFPEMHVSLPKMSIWTIFKPKIAFEDPQNVPRLWLKSDFPTIFLVHEHPHLRRPTVTAKTIVRELLARVDPNTPKGRAAHPTVSDLAQRRKP